MSIELYEHNQKAYDAAVSLMSETGKAAVIHPTGTGKSFIGFKLAEQHPDNLICWLSPSEYIFKTQIENLKSATDGYAPDNIYFMTYAKLMLTDDDRIEKIEPDYIILDEFHRCGATEWGKGVERLLDAYPDVPILGLSATNIRYLDNQRDMADELFDGNIASEMTLGEAIVRNILLPPIYITSIYSYQKDLEKYQYKVRKARNKIVRDAAQKYLDKLRRTLTKADGLDVIFDKHIKDRSGKFIVFCANVEHMNEMIERVSEWFYKVDENPHIYRVYSEDSNSAKELEAFKQDDSDSLKLLYCISMLNEGVHVENISGLLLLRPTVSPIIYKQQIGRALSAGKGQTPVIFDIVNNFENLYNISSIEAEMEEAIKYFHGSGDDEKIINANFHIIDEVQDSKRLFDELNKTLSSSWEVMFEAAKRYKENFGDLLPSRSYKTEEQLALGEWINLQRSIKSGAITGTMSAEQERLLTSIGMVWDVVPEIDFENNYHYAQEYFAEYSVLDADSSYVSPDGFPFGLWLRQIRVARKNSARFELSERHIAMLDELNMVWDLSTYLSMRYFEKGCEAYIDYTNTHGFIDVPSKYRTKDNFKLGVWATYTRRRRAEGQLGEERIRRLDDIGFIWKGAMDSEWNFMYRKACEYREQFGSLNPVCTYRTPDGMPLGGWIQRQRTIEKNGKLSKTRREKLDAIEMIWDFQKAAWLEKYGLAVEYYETKGSIADIPKQFVVETESGRVALGEWIYRQRKLYNGKVKEETLEEWQIEKLNAVGMRWSDYSDEMFHSYLMICRDFYKKNGHLNPSAYYKGSNGKRLYQWLQYQRKRYESGVITDEQAAALSEFGMEWEYKTVDLWEESYNSLKKYIEANGNPDNIPRKELTAETKRLKNWIQGQRLMYKGTIKINTLTPERIKRLEELGIRLAPTDPWIEAFEKAEAYYRKYGDINTVSRGYKKTIGFDLWYWLGKQRSLYREGKLTEQQTEKLEGIGIIWDSLPEQQWEKHYAELRAYVQKHGMLPPASYRTGAGFKLGGWVYNQRKKRLAGKLTDEQVRLLDSLGFIRVLTSQQSKNTDSAGRVRTDSRNSMMLGK